MINEYIYFVCIFSSFTSNDEWDTHTQKSDHVFIKYSLKQRVFFAY